MAHYVGISEQAFNNGRNHRLTFNLCLKGYSQWLTWLNGLYDDRQSGLIIVGPLNPAHGPEQPHRIYRAVRTSRRRLFRDIYNAFSIGFEGGR
jgi:hypothetical protein